MNLYGFVGNDGIDRLDYLGNIDLERLKQETGVAEAIASKTLLPVKGYIGWNRTTSCDDRCHVKFEIKEAYVGNYSYKNNEKHKAFGIYVYITGNLIERTDEECQDLRIVQYGRFIQDHDRSLPTGNPTNKVGIMNENRWWVDSTTEMQENGRPNVDSTGLSDVDGLNFDLFDPPANSHDREPKRGIEFLTCAYARCRTKGGDLGPSRELGCLHWGFVPRVEKGKIAAVEPLRGTPEVLCNVTEHQGAMAKWMRKYGKNRN